jgi:hypothetical protein
VDADPTGRSHGSSHATRLRSSRCAWPRVVYDAASRSSTAAGPQTAYLPEPGMVETGTSTRLRSASSLQIGPGRPVGLRAAAAGPLEAGASILRQSDRLFVSGASGAFGGTASTSTSTGSTTTIGVVTGNGITSGSTTPSWSPGRSPHSSGAQHDAALTTLRSLTDSE